MAAVRLARSLSRLTSVITFMNVGAHPDDESSGLLAALRYRFGFRIVIACSTRGEGGQSDLGPERGVALAALRTRETEEAARQLDASIAWLGFGPGDGVSDFGFSRNADDTLARWGETRLLSRLVEAYRRWRPDIVAPTFLDVPGQHGHHRAMTRSAIKAVDLAADGKAFPEQIAAGLAPWRVAKLYLPAWSGAGSSYDDEVPPPPATTVVRAPGRDWLTGATYSQIGEWSRFFHASQGMGVWRDPGPEAWPLHLAVSQGGSGRAEQGIEDGLPRAVGDLAAIPGLADGPRKRLLDAQRAIESAVRAFPDRAQIIDGAAAAARAIDDALAGLSARLRPLLAHKLERKRREIGQVLVEAQGIVVRVVAQPDRIPPGEETSVAVTVDPGDPPVPLAARLETRDGLVGHGEPARASATLTASARDDAGFTSPFAADFDPLGPNGNMSVRVDSELGGLRLTHHVDLDNRLRVLPAASLTVDPEALIVNLARPVAPIMLRASADAAAPDLTLAAPAGWTVTPRPGNATTAAWTIEPPAHLASGRFEFAPRIDGRTAYRIVTASYAHVGEVAFARPASIAGLAVDAALPDGARVGYVGGGNDNVAVWLRQLGVAVTELA
ncbi:MAG: PIG-L family deacetylase, partial [Bauldia sp.]